MSDSVVLSTMPQGKPTATRVMSAASTNAITLKTTGGAFFGFALSNSAAYDCFLKLYNKATAPVIGTDVPKVTFRLKTTWDRDMFNEVGVNFPLGIYAAITKLAADSDTTVIAVNDIMGEIYTL